VTLSGVVVGSGKRGVVLGHQNQSYLCSWFPFADELAAAGYTVLALDFRGFGSSSAWAADKPKTLQLDMLAGATFLRSQGVTAMVLGGASMGGTAAIVAAGTKPPGVVGVFSVSAPGMFDVMDALVAAKALRVPSLFLAAVNDGEYATAAQQLHDAVPSGTGTLQLVTGSAHGTQLVGSDPVVPAAIKKYVLARLR
jgi:pimeloyl-ACP methyl ester carboxylesterase